MSLQQTLVTTPTANKINIPSEIEKPVEQWSVDEVVQWAKNFIIPEYASILEDQVVDGKALLHQTKEDLYRYGMPGGPSSIIAVEIEKLNGVME